jgi:hypothetical protein
MEFHLRNTTMHDILGIFFAIDIIRKVFETYTNVIYEYSSYLCNQK